MQIKLNDISFYGDASTSKYHDIKNFSWYRGPEPTTKDSNLVFFTDLCFSLITHPAYKSTYNVAMLLEPMAINPHAYEFIAAHHNRFNLVLSHHTEYLKQIPNGQYYINGMSWVAEQDWGKHEKTKNLCIFASNKNYVVGHSLRHELIRRAKDKMDLFGSGYEYVKHKADVLKNYKFSVAIENSSVPSYFTEKIIDCFATYTMPIYWGCPTIGEFFDPNGILYAKNLEDLLRIVDTVNNDPDGIYNRKETQQALENNFLLAKKYAVAEDWIFDHILKPNKLV